MCWVGLVACLLLRDDQRSYYLDRVYIDPKLVNCEGLRMSKQTLMVPSKTVQKFNDWKKDFINGKYRAYIPAHKANKISRRHLIYCMTQKREVSCLSDGERRTYAVQLNIPSTVAVMEQFALDIDETLDIAVALNIRHPCNWKTGEAYVMTTDFVVQRATGDLDRPLRTIAYTFKYWDKIYKMDPNGKRVRISRRTWEKFEIERAFWNSKGIEYRVITELDATKAQLWNIDFCRAARGMSVPESEMVSFLNAFDLHWSNEPYLTLKQLVNRVASDLQINEDYSFKLFKFGVLNWRIAINRAQYLRTFRPVYKSQNDEIGELL